ncbi:uncharacterized protein LOC125466881 [Stegostoma tigrinum]|uniref:uncharacterized protein LOC125466881 n=1 Tax=Stegostoma tigrinum TaxID=3053191 RepID=UPI00202AC2D2|nr:uncharacterized protein LOC125466881 [Stegostoma tigrinum]
MKIFAVALVLLLAKGVEGRVLPGASDGGPTHGEQRLALLDLGNTTMNIHNINPILEKLAQNMTLLTEEIQQQLQTFSTHFHEQASTIRERLSSLFEQPPALPEGISKLTSPNLTQQLEILKKNISRLSLNFKPVSFNQTSEKKVYQELAENLDQFHQLFAPVLNFFQGTITEGVENLRKSMGPGVHEIKKLVELSKSTKLSGETPESH